jgi:hypothetical protein
LWCVVGHDDGGGGVLWLIFAFGSRTTFVIPPPFRPNVTMKTKKSSNTRICADRKPIEERVGPEKTVFQEEKL